MLTPSAVLPGSNSLNIAAGIRQAKSRHNWHDGVTSPQLKIERLEQPRYLHQCDNTKLCQRILQIVQFAWQLSCQTAAAITLFLHTLLAGWLSGEGDAQQESATQETRRKAAGASTVAMHRILHSLRSLDHLDADLLHILYSTCGWPAALMR